MLGAILGAVGSIAGGLLGSSASKSAANQQAQANAQAIAEQQRQFDAVQKLLSPYATGGTSALSSLLALTGVGGTQGGVSDWSAYLSQNPDVAAEAQRVVGLGQFASPEEYAQYHYGTFGQNEGRSVPTSTGVSAYDAQAQAISQFENSPTFQALARQGEQGILQNASATGGLRGGNTQGALAQFRPALLNQQIQQQIGNLNSIASLGQNAAAGVGNAGISTGQGISSLLQNTGQAQAYGTLGSANALAQGLTGAFGGLGTVLGGVGSSAQTVNSLGGGFSNFQLPGIITGYGSGTFDTSGRQVTF